MTIGPQGLTGSGIFNYQMPGSSNVRFALAVAGNGVKIVMVDHRAGVTVCPQRKTRRRVLDRRDIFTTAAGPRSACYEHVAAAVHGDGVDDIIYVRRSVVPI